MADRGDCALSAPPDKERRHSSALHRKEWQEVPFHKLVPAAEWHVVETVVAHLARDAAHVLWRLRYRQPEEIYLMYQHSTPFPGRPVAPGELSAEQRRRELAGIFAAGILRLRSLRKRVEGTPSPKQQANSKSRSPRLEVSGGTVLSVPKG